MTAQATYRKKDIWKIAYPIMISLLMEQLIGMTDTAFMGRVGEVELGASAIGAVFYMMIFMMGFGFSVGAQIIIARRNGEGNYRDIGNVFFQGLYIISAIALVMSGLSLWFSDSLIEMAVSSPDVARAAEDYINYRVFGLLFAFAAAMFRAFFVGTTQTRTLTLNSIVMVLSNVLFNWILVFGKFGFPALGIAGAAIGSVLAEAVSLMFFILYTRFRVDCRKYGLDRIYRPDEGDRQQIHFSFRVMKRYFRLRRDALKNSPRYGSRDLFFAFFGTRDHYRRSGIVSIRTYRKYFGDTYALYPGSHFMENEFVLSMLLPKIRSLI